MLLSHLLKPAVCVLLGGSGHWVFCCFYLSDIELLWIWNCNIKTITCILYSSTHVLVSTKYNTPNISLFFNFDVTRSCLFHSHSTFVSSIYHLLTRRSHISSSSHLKRYLAEKSLLCRWSQFHRYVYHSIHSNATTTNGKFAPFDNAQ